LAQKNGRTGEVLLVRAILPFQETGVENEPNRSEENGGKKKKSDKKSFSDF
jgi:hypothetical protein